MAVYLGDSGCFELGRTSLDEDFFATIAPADINEDTDRFSFEFPVGQYLTGDLIEITSTNGATLDFIDSGWPIPSPTTTAFFIYVTKPAASISIGLPSHGWRAQRPHPAKRNH